MPNFSTSFSFRALYIWAVNLSREKFERDQISALTYARERGLKKGIVIGEKRGRAEDTHTKAVEMARNFLRMGLPAEKVAEGTGLSLSEIQNLK